jgi:hypothetical protein
MARCVCALADEDLTEHLISNQTEDARLWIFWLLETLNQADLARGLIMGLLGWRGAKLSMIMSFRVPLQR